MGLPARFIFDNIMIYQPTNWPSKADLKAIKRSPHLFKEWFVQFFVFALERVDLVIEFGLGFHELFLQRAKCPDAAPHRRRERR